MTDFYLLAQQWLEQDQDPDTLSEITALITAPNDIELEKRFSSRISFGTAGLRGRMQAGSAHMNALTVIQASQGLAAYLLTQMPDAQQRGVVIGRDARHNSEKFARLAAAAFVAKGIKVWWLEQLAHTPLVPYSMQMVGAAAGVMVTASHNPAQDNGYKVYWANAAQIIAPHDKGIAAAIEQNLAPVSWDRVIVDSGSDLVEHIFDRAKEGYLQAVSQFVGGSLEWPKFVYTPMHGVGLPFLSGALEHLSQHEPSRTKVIRSTWHVVPEQANPDPDFPTVKYPNPEEKGALDKAQEYAESLSPKSAIKSQSIPLIIASDPDADRFSAAEHVNGVWRQFSGNEIGALLADHIWHLAPRPDPSRYAMLSTTVSSNMLAAMATAEGFHWEDTLTGFKWLSNVSLALSRAGQMTPLFAFEEALGYMFPSIVPDKDGIAAAIVFLQAVSTWAAQGLTPYAKLQQLHQRYGFFASANTYLVSPSPDRTHDVFAAIRALAPPGAAFPPMLGSHTLTSWRDLTVPHQYDSETPTHEPTLPVSRSQMITCMTARGVRFTVRASGTEPKIKLYVEGRGASMEEAEREAKEVQQSLITEWFTPERWGLTAAY